MYLNTHIFPTTGYARVLLFMFIRRELMEERYRMFISVYILWFWVLKRAISLDMTGGLRVKGLLAIKFISLAESLMSFLLFH